MRSLLLALSLTALSTAASAQVDTDITAAANGLTTNNWDICNETSYVLRFASAYIRSDRMQANGWSTVQPGACELVVTPKDSPRFLFAESLSIHRGGIREWKGSVELCASETDFSSDATDNCRLKNMTTRNYFAVNPTERRTAFIEPSDFGENSPELTACLGGGPYEQSQKLNPIWTSIKLPLIKSSSPRSYLLQKQHVILSEWIFAMIVLSVFSALSLFNKMEAGPRAAGGQLKVGTVPNPMTVASSARRPMFLRCKKPLIQRVSLYQIAACAPKS